VLHKCYRNPREVLVCAHAVGFGIYSPSIVQMLENREHWEDIGYRVVEGDFTRGSLTRIERPPGHSLASISNVHNIDEIVQAGWFNTFDEEIAWVTAAIQRDLAEGLRAEDILIVVVDDRNARAYIDHFKSSLYAQSIRSHNIHGAFGEVDFQADDCVTLSTVHKAKGNEAFMVYVVGVDALYPRPTVRQRNMLFTAMTRAKGWLRVTGFGSEAQGCVAEIQQAKQNFPHLVFNYPSPEALKVMQRDLEESESRRLKAERLIEQAAGNLSREEFESLLKKMGAASAKGAELEKRGKR
jgi:superfamily I DNA and RNA helicase